MSAAPGGRRLSGDDVPALAALVLLCLTFLWQLVLGGRVMAGPDAFTYFYPMYGYAAERLLAGELPLWNPYLFLGTPFLANPQAGVFYPLHWPLLWLPAPYMAGASLAIHYALLACFMYAFLRLGRGHGIPGSLAGAVVLALGGLAGSQAEHVNQVEALAWLPLQALVLERAVLAPGGRRRWPAPRWLALGTLATAMQLLAGHTQAVYVCQVTLGVYAVARGLSAGGTVGRRARPAGLGLLFVGLAAALAAAVAAVQLVPTLELAGLSPRSGGLPYRQAVSFSFAPRAWLLGLLPHYGAEDAFSEYAAWVGVAGLALALLGLGRGSRRRWLGVVVAGAGLFLALGAYNPAYYLLYRLVPGFDLFRAPARWLIAYSFGVAMLVAEGMAALRQRPLRLPWRRAASGAAATAAVLAALCAIAEPRPEAVTVAAWALALGAFVLIARGGRPAVRLWGMAALVGLELLLASLVLPYNQGTAAHAYFAERRAPQVMAQADEPYRFLSLSSGRFDPGDMPDLLATVGGALTPAGRYGLLVTSKWQELLARNLPLAWRRHAVDGYDGGVLPTRDFVRFQSLYLPAEDVSPDGRLSEALAGMPPARLLALAGVRYVVMDRIDDAWIDGVYYDLGLPLALAAGETAAVPLPAFPATAVGLVLALPAGAEAGETATAEVRVGDAAPFRVTVGEGAGETLLADGRSLEGRPLPGRSGEHHLLLSLGRASYPAGLRLAVEAGGAGLVVRGLALVNEDVAAGVPVLPGAADGVAAIHYGDVKVYEIADTLPRAYFRACASYATTPEEALEAMRRHDWDPRDQLLLVGVGPSTCAAEGATTAVRLIEEAPERVLARVVAPEAGYVVLLDSYYPGWEARVDGRPAPVLRANFAFRAVPVPAGEHLVEFAYRPAGLARGAAVSAVGLALLLGLALLSSASRNRA